MAFPVHRTGSLAASRTPPQLRIHNLQVTKHHYNPPRLSNMHTTLITCPMRTAVLGGRLSSTALGPFASSNSSSSIYHTISLKPPARAASTTTTRFNRLRSSQTTATPFTAHSRPQKLIAPSCILQSSSIRANSTAARAEAAKLDWNSFFKLRASRRRYTLASSIATSLAGTAIGAQVLSSQDLESLGAQVMGMEPFVVLGIATMACGAVGWLIGPFLGNAVWGLVHRQYSTAVVVKEKEFFDRIKRFRVDPSSNSIANPVPDYYGEKIGSVQGYRQWLKDQRAYNRKRRSFIL